jgi:hypothetical protein
MCCWEHHHSRHHRNWSEPCYPRCYGGWSTPSPRGEYVRRLEEEHEMLEQRLRRLEQELEALRQQA